MKKTFIVLKENYLRQIKSWSFITLVLAPFAFLIIMTGISYLEAKNSSDNDICLPFILISIRFLIKVIISFSDKKDS